MKLLLVGLGPWGEKLMHVIREHPRAALSGVVTTKPSRATGTARFRTLDDALSACAWDGVVLATPPLLHAAQLEECLRRGIATLVEKPLCLDVATAERLRSIAGETPVLVDHIYLFHSGYRELKAQVRDSGISPSRIRSEGGNWGPFRQDCGPLWDYGVHDLALHLDLMNEEPRAVRAKRFGENFEIEMDFTAGSSSIRTGNRFPGRKRRLEATVGAQTLMFEEYGGGGRGANTPLFNLIDAFVDGIQGKCDDRWGLDLAVSVTNILSECEKQLRDSPAC